MNPKFNNKKRFSSKNKKLTTNDILEIRKKYNPITYSYGMISKEYNIGRTTVFNIINKGYRQTMANFWDLTYQKYMANKNLHQKMFDRFKDDEMVVFFLTLQYLVLHKKTKHTYAFSNSNIQDGLFEIGVDDTLLKDISEFIYDKLPVNYQIIYRSSFCEYQEDKKVYCFKVIKR